MSTKDNTTNYIVHMVDRTIQILEYIFNKDGPAGIREISNHLDIPKATVYRLLYTLKAHGFVNQNKNDLYYLGNTFISYGSKVKQNLNFLNICKPLMEKTCAKTQEFINIGTLHEHQVVLLETIVGDDFFASKTLIPTTPLYCSSLGKIFLSHFDSLRLENYLENTSLDFKTIATIQKKSSLIKEIEQVKKDGIGYDREEYEYGLSCCATYLGCVEGRELSYSISGPTTRINHKGWDFIESELKELTERTRVALLKAEIDLTY